MNDEKIDQSNNPPHKQVDATDRIVIGPNGLRDQRILGSGPHVELLNVQHMGGGDDEPTPPEAISAPDIGVQVDDRTGKLAAQISVVIDVLKETFGGDAEVRQLTDPTTTQVRIGLWLRRSASSADDAARDRGMAALYLVPTGKTFGLFVNRSYLWKKGDEAWANQTKRLDSEGRPDPNGSVHLTSYSTSFASADNDIATTIVHGFDDRLFPDIDFTMTIKERLQIVSGSVLRPDKPEVKFQTEPSWVHYLEAIIAPTLFPTNIFWSVQTAGIITAGAPDKVPIGIGGRLVEQLPKEFIIPGGKKIVLLYDGLFMDATGFYTNGFVGVPDRTPSVQITGPVSLRVRQGAGATERYSYSAHDMLNPQPIWTADASVTGLNQQAVYVAFNTDGAREGDVITRKVTVELKDQDGLTATHTLIVSITIVHSSGRGPDV